MTIITLFGNKKILSIIFLLLFCFVKNLYAIENKILIKVNNEIITTLDIKEEINYLNTLNPRLNNLSDNEIFNISKNSLIREKIKKDEISKYIDIIELNHQLLENYIQSTYRRLGMSSIQEFENHLKSNNLNIEKIKKKISIEAIWNQIIYSKFFNKVKINKNEIEKRVISKKNKKIKDYLLSEIIFKLPNNKNLDEIYKKIINKINTDGFENAAITFSLSDSAKLGGKVGWIEENSLNEKIQNKLAELNIGDLTSPIITAGGFMILKIDNIKLKERKIDINKDVEKLIKLETNRQLNQYSNIYFSKIEKNYKIDEL